MKTNLISPINKENQATIMTIVLALIFSLAFVVFANRANAQSPLITSNLHIGSRGTDVTDLQQFLAQNSAIYPSGIVTGYYGNLTAAAVTQFQVNYDLPQVGVVGPMTRAKINQVQAAGYGLNISAPVISTIAVSTSTASNNSAVVSWATNKNAMGKIHYDTNWVNGNEASAAFQEPYLSGSTLNVTSVNTGQSVTLGSLSPHTTYHYVIEAIDPSGNVNLSPQYSFTTSN